MELYAFMCHHLEMLSHLLMHHEYVQLLYCGPGGITAMNDCCLDSGGVKLFFLLIFFYLSSMRWTCNNKKRFAEGT